MTSTFTQKNNIIRFVYAETTVAENEILMQALLIDELTKTVEQQKSRIEFLEHENQNDNKSLEELDCFVNPSLCFTFLHT